MDVPSKLGAFTQETEVRGLCERKSKETCFMLNFVMLKYVVLENSLICCFGTLDNTYFVA